MTENETDWSEYNKPDEKEEKNILSKITDAVLKMKEQELSVLLATTKLAEETEKLTKIKQVELVSLMEEAQQTELKTIFGHVVKLQSKIQISTTGKKAPALYSWLKKSGNGSIIKNELTVKFDQKESEEAVKLKKVLLGEDHNISHDKIALVESVHAQTAKALLNELVKEGIDIPYETIGAYSFKTVEAKLPKL